MWQACQPDASMASATAKQIVADELGVDVLLYRQSVEEGQHHGHDLVDTEAAEVGRPAEDLFDALADRSPQRPAVSQELGTNLVVADTARRQKSKSTSSHSLCSVKASVKSRPMSNRASFLRVSRVLPARTPRIVPILDIAWSLIMAKKRSSLLSKFE